MQREPTLPNSKVKVVFFHGSQDTKVEPRWESKLTRTAVSTAVWMLSAFPDHLPLRL